VHLPHLGKSGTFDHQPHNDYHREGRLSIRLVDRGSHRLQFHSQFHYDVSPTIGQGFHVSIWGPNHSDRKALQGGYDRVEGGSATEEGYRRTLPQHKLGLLTGGKIGVESAVTAKGSLS
jgi:hypothetical protein